MALDTVEGGSGGCLKCGGTGMYTERLSGKQAIELMGRHIPDGATVEYAHFTAVCNCPRGEALSRDMHIKEPRP